MTRILRGFEAVNDHCGSLTRAYPCYRLSCSIALRENIRGSYTRPLEWFRICEPSTDREAYLENPRGQQNCVSAMRNNA
ncbi:hypothetical protein IG631_23400 [Alternaria alternata]|nr:hypothetical protein IG631_23400 [Alternaria alternata]